MWAVDHNKTGKRATVREGGHPGDAATPVVADEQGLAGVRGPDQTFDVGDEVVDVVVRDAAGPARTAVAAEVRGPDPVSQLGQHRHLVAPGECALREPMEAERKPVARSALRDLESQTIGFDESCRLDGGGHHWAVSFGRLRKRLDAPLLNGGVSGP